MKTSIYCILILIIYQILNVKSAAAQEVNTTTSSHSMQDLSSHSYDGNSANNIALSNGNGHVDVGVDPYTGRIQLNLDLGNAGSVFTNVALTYSSSGFKASMPSNIMGIGWNLNCGGAITRQVRGIPDEVSKSINNDVDATLEKKFVNPYLNNLRIQNFNSFKPHNRSDNNLSWEPEEDRFVEKLANNEYDTQYDIFTISAAGISGSFYIKADIENQDPKIISIGLNSLEIIPVWTKASVSGFSTQQVVGIASFQVKCPDGSIYYFTKPVDVTTDLKIKQEGNYIGKFEVTNGPLLPQPDIPSLKENNVVSVVRNSWLLEKVVTPTLGEINLTYFDGNFSQTLVSKNLMTNPVFVGLNTYGFCGVIPQTVKSIYTTNIHYTSPVLTSITTQNEKMDFTYEGNGKGSEGINWMLKGIKFYSFSNFDKEIVFTYYNGSALNRNFLRSIQEYNKFNKSVGPIEFGYNSLINFLSSTSLNVDYWGYPNGKSISPPYSDAFFPTDAERNTRGLPNINFGISGLISTISYPNKVVTSIFYEQNRSYEKLKSTSYWEGNAGGYRVSKIKRLDPITNLTKERTFRYGRKDPILINGTVDNRWKGGFPIFSQINNDPNNPIFDIHYARKSQTGLIQFGNTTNISNYYFAKKYLINYDMIQSAPIYQLEDEFGRSVVYTLFEETHEDGSSIVYKFSEPVFYNPTNIKICTGVKNLRTPGSPDDIPIRVQQEAYDSYSGVNSMQKLNGTENSSLIFNSNIKNNFPAAEHNQLPEEIVLSERYNFRSNLYRRLNPTLPGGDIEEEFIFRKDGKLLSNTKKTYQFFSISSLKKININGLVNYSSYIFATYVDQYNYCKAYLKDHYKGDHYPATAQMYGVGQVFVFDFQEENYGINQVKDIITTDYDLSRTNSSGMRTDISNSYIDLPFNKRLHGKLRSTIKSTFKDPLASTDAPIKISTYYRYPSDFLETNCSTINALKRTHLDQAIWNNEGYFAQGNCERLSLGFAYLCHGI